VVVDAEHVVGRNALRDADDRLDAGVDRLVDRVRREARRDEHHRRVGLGLGDSLADGVEDGDALDVGAALPGVTPATTFVPYVLLRAAWNEPSRPVMPWTTRRVSASTMIAITASFP
jgi:hypothetical protein